MNSALSFRMRAELGCCLLFAAAAVFAALEARAQEVRLPVVSAPPPMKFIPRTEREHLGSVRDAKGRTRTAIELAEARLLRAEQLTTTQQFSAASDELGIYQGIIEDAIRFLNNARTSSNKMRDTYKRLELALRTHSTRIESIRRATPTEYKVNVNNIVDFTCGVRTEALNGFFGDAVMRETGCEKGDPTATTAKESSAESSGATTKKQND